MAGRLIFSGASRKVMQDFVAGLANRALAILEAAERKAFLENEIQRFYGFRRVEIAQSPEGPERFSSESTRVRDTLSRVLGFIEGTRQPFLNETVGKSFGGSGILPSIQATYAFPLRRGDVKLGALIIDSSPRSLLGGKLEKSLLSLSSQVAIVLENSHLLMGRLKLQQALAEQTQMAQLGQMTARIAHEIKNPLSAIKTIIQVMQEDKALHEQYGRDLQLVNSEVDRLAGSVMQLLNFARPLPDRKEPVHLHQEAASVLTFLERDIAQSKIRVDNEIPEDLPGLAAAPGSIREILLNLILNALQAGGEGMLLRLQAWRGVLDDGSEQFILLVLEDDGPGIAAPLQAQVFTPFFTTKQKGTGLGLAIVKRNVERLGGRIGLESPVREGRGTRFLIHLPVNEAEPE